MLKVLILDDNVDERAQVVRTVKKVFGDDVAITEEDGTFSPYPSDGSPYSQFKACFNQHYDLVITDYHMTDNVNGLSVIYAVRDSKVNHDAKIIGHSSDSGKCREMENAGANVSCKKPESPGDNYPALEEALNKLFPYIASQSAIENRSKTGPTWIE